jgi:uncharacterized membrane protein
MSRYTTASFFLLYGLTVLLTTNIPPWLVGCVAIVAGLTIVVESLKPAK